MEFSIRFDTVRSRWSIVYVEGPQDIISKKYCISFSLDAFVLANSVSPDEIPHHAAKVPV